MNESNDIMSRPYAEFLEQFLAELAQYGDVDCMAVEVRLPDRSVLTGYYEATAEDKALFAHHLSSDAMFDELEANGTWLRDVVDGADEDGADVETL